VLNIAINKQKLKFSKIPKSKGGVAIFI